MDKRFTHDEYKRFFFEDGMRLIKNLERHVIPNIEENLMFSSLCANKLKFNLKPRMDSLLNAVRDVFNGIMLPLLHIVFTVTFFYQRFYKYYMSGHIKLAKRNDFLNHSSYDALLLPLKAGLLRFQQEKTLKYRRFAYPEVLIRVLMVLPGGSIFKGDKTSFYRKSAKYLYLNLLDIAVHCLLVRFVLNSLDNDSIKDENWRTLKNDVYLFYTRNTHDTICASDMVKYFSEEARYYSRVFGGEVVTKQENISGFRTWCERVRIFMLNNAHLYKSSQYDPDLLTSTVNNCDFMQSEFFKFFKKGEDGKEIFSIETDEALAETFEAYTWNIHIFMTKEHEKYRKISENKLAYDLKHDVTETLDDSFRQMKAFTLILPSTIRAYQSFVYEGEESK